MGECFPVPCQVIKLTSLQFCGGAISNKEVNTNEGGVAEDRSVEVGVGRAAAGRQRLWEALSSERELIPPEQRNDRSHLLLKIF